MLAGPYGGKPLPLRVIINYLDELVLLTLSLSRQ